jgi:hypothetical protein
MVSPVNKNGGEINGIDGVVPNEGLPEGGMVQASEDGNAITYVSLIAFPGSKEGDPLGAPLASQYLTSRQPGGWLTQNITPSTTSKNYSIVGAGAPYRAFSSDLSQGLMLAGQRPLETPPLTRDAPARYQNFYTRDLSSGAFTALVKSAPSESPEEFKLEVRGTSANGQHSVFETTGALSPNASHQGEGNLYEWIDGRFEPINVPPGGSGQTSAGESLLGSRFNEGRTISEDGSRVVWTQFAARKLFVTEGIGTEHAEPVQIDVPQGGVDQGGDGEFRTASDDDTRIFFTDSRRLTPGSTAGDNPNQQDLYEFDLAQHKLTDLTIDPIDEGGAAVRGVLGASADGSYVYFVAEGALPGTAGEAAHNNLYVWHEGAVRLIAELAEKDSSGVNREPTFAHDWAPSNALRTARVSPDGRHLLFMSQESLTGYDNRDIATGHPDEEVFLYDAETGHMKCISCNPSGSRPVGPSGFPGGTASRIVPEEGTYEPRVLSEGADRVFFDSRDALVPQDDNGAQDVYQWEQDATGTCTQPEGCVSLLSGGTSTSDSSLVDASVNGNDVFFVTRAQLVGSDTDSLRDLYDDRVGGGLAEPAAPAAPCEGEECLAASTPPKTPGSLPSATYSGAGNIPPTSSPPSKPPSAAQLRAAKLAKALRACKRKRSRHARSTCEKQAHRTYGKRH